MSLSRTSFRQLEAFSAVAELRSFAASGARLGMTASAVSQLVAELESIVGFRLFDRTTRRVDISSAGRDYLASVQPVLRHLKAADSVAHDVRERASGLVRIGAPLALASAAIPACIRGYRKLKPNVAVRLRDVSVDMLGDAVANGDVDLAVGPERIIGTDVVGSPVFESPWVLWCAPSHPLAAHSSLLWSQLDEVNLVAVGRYHEHHVSKMLLDVPIDKRITPIDIVDHLTTAFGIAAQGLACTLTPAYVGVVAQAYGLVMRRVLEPETVRKICIYRSAHRTLSPAGEGFAAFLSRWLAEWHEQPGVLNPHQ